MKFLAISLISILVIVYLILEADTFELIPDRFRHFVPKWLRGR